jgi:hypothetical protein
LGAGLATGFAGLAGGWAIGVVGDAAVRNYAFQSRVFVGMVLILIFAEVLGASLDQERRLMFARSLRAYCFADSKHQSHLLCMLMNAFTIRYAAVVEFQ